MGSGPRYALGQADYAANKANEYQFESLHKIYFYDAWRWKIELNQPDSPLRLPPRPGLLQNGCYWHQPALRPTDAIHSCNIQENAAPAQNSLAEISSVESEEALPPSEVPEPASQGQATESPTSPITIGSTEEEQAGSQNNATEPSEEATPAATIASTGEGDKAQEVRTEGTAASPVTNAAARAAEPSEPTEGVRAEESEETESGTTDEVIELDVSNEASPARSKLPSKSARAAVSDGYKSNGGHQRDRLLASSSTAGPIDLPSGEAKRRN